MTDRRKSTLVDLHVGRRIRLVRTTRGTSQSELGGSLGVTFQQIQKYENGTNRIGAGRLQSISNLFNVPITFFFEGMPEQPATTNNTEEQGEIANLIRFLNSSEGIELARAFTKIQDAFVRQTIIDLIQALGNNKSNGRHHPFVAEDSISKN